MTDAIGRQPDVRVLTEEELAYWLRESGRRVVFSRGRFWVNYWGFFRLLHFAAAMPAERFARPSDQCWAYHGLLTDGDARHANAWSPLHLVRNLATFDEGMLDSSARKQLRRCRARFKVVRMTNPDLLCAQGWPIFSQNARRLGKDTVMVEARYRAELHRVMDPRQLVLGVMDGDRLLAYLETYAVEGTAYLSEIRLGDDAMRQNVSGLLHFEATQIYRRSGLVSQVCPGPPLLERPGVSEFKRRWGMPIVRMPARFWSPAPLRALLKAVRPGAYYRATGRPTRGMSPEIRAAGG